MAYPGYYEDIIVSVGNGYLATKHNLSSFDGLTGSRKRIRRIEFDVLFDRVASVSMRVPVYLLSVDPRTLNVTGLQEKADKVVYTQLSMASGGNKKIVFSDLNLSGKNDFYIVLSFAGAPSGTSIKLGPPKPTITYEDIEFSASIDNQNVLSGSSISFGFTNRDDDDVSISLECDGTALYQAGGIKSDSASITCPRQWFADAGRSSANTMEVSAVISCGGETVTHSFTVQAYQLSVTSTPTLSIDETFIAQIRGDTNGAAITARFRHGDTVLYQETLSGDEIRKICERDWFTAAGVSANSPMSISADFIDQDGKSVTASFNLSAPQLGIRSLQNVCMAETELTFSVISRLGETLSVRFMCGENEITSTEEAGDSFSVSFNRNVVPDNTSNVNDGVDIDILAEDSFGRSASCRIRLTLPAITVTAENRRWKAGTQMRFTISGSIGENVSARLRYGSTELCRQNTTEENFVVDYQKSWFYENVNELYNGKTVWMDITDTLGRTASCSVVMWIPKLEITAGKQSVTVYGTEDFSVSERLDEVLSIDYRYNGVTFLSDTASDDTFTAVCTSAWFADSHADVNTEMSTEAYAADSFGRTASCTFSLVLPRLRVVGNTNRVTTGVAGSNEISVAIENRNIDPGSDTAITLTVKSGVLPLWGEVIRADTYSVTCIKDWFETLRVNTQSSIPLSIVATDSLGRSGSFSFTLYAGDDMEPILYSPELSVVQADEASAFPDIYIAEYSRAKCKVQIRAQTSADIVYASIKYDNGVYSLTRTERLSQNIYTYEFTTPQPLTHDTTFYITIRDERGVEKTTRVSATGVHHYTPPSFTVNTLYRSDENGVEVVGGSYYTINATAVYDRDLPGNEIVKFTSSVTNGEEHDLTSSTTSTFFSGLNTTKRYTVHVAIQDKLSQVITTSWTLTGGAQMIASYNQLVDEYTPFNDTLEKIPETITGYPALMQAYFGTIDMELFLRSGMMPTVSVSSTTADREAAKLTQAALSPVAVSNLSTCSTASASSAVLSVAKCIVRGSYKVKVKNGSYNAAGHIWTGNFTVTNYGDEDDTADSDMVSVALHSDMTAFVRQKIDTALNQEGDDATDIVSLFALEDNAFSDELEKYSLNRLLSFRDACQGCLDILIQSGASSVSTTANLIPLDAYSGNTIDADTGVQLSVRNDGSILLNGTAAHAFYFYFADLLDKFSLQKGYYTYSMNTTSDGVNALFGEEKTSPPPASGYATQYSVMNASDFSDGPFRVIVHGAGNTDETGWTYTGRVVIGFSVDAGTSFTNYIIQPSLENGTIQHKWISPAVGTASDANLSQNDDLYYNLYQPYMVKMELIDAQIKKREHELAIVTGEYDSQGHLVANGVQTVLLAERDAIQAALNFHDFLGDTLWKEMSCYRRDDILSNANYISDGLNNSELMANAQEFITTARREIVKSATAQHSISGDIHNLLMMDEFKPLADKFRIGNWIHVGVDGSVYRLRLYSYIIDYDEFALEAEFTDVKRGMDSASDVGNLLGRMQSISTSYDSVARQAASGKKSKDLVDEWSETGISISTKVVSKSGGQELTLNHGGVGGREYDANTGMYVPTQVKMTSGGIFATTDSWGSGKTVVGDYSYNDPETGKTVNGFGSVAEMLMGRMVLYEPSSIFTENGEIMIGTNGIKTSDMTVTGDLLVRGTKNRIASTADYGDRLMYSYETASPLFGDVGEGQIDESGVCTVTLDPVFAQTISTSQYQVFLQCYGDGQCHVSERNAGFFVVIGTPGMHFAWEVKARQAGYESARMESADR